MYGMDTRKKTFLGFQGFFGRFQRFNAFWNIKFIAVLLYCPVEGEGFIFYWLLYFVN